MCFCSSFTVWSMNVSRWVDINPLNINHSCLPRIPSKLTLLGLVHWVACFPDWRLPILERYPGISLLRESSAEGKVLLFQIHLLHLRKESQVHWLMPCVSISFIRLQPAVLGCFSIVYYSHFWLKLPQAQTSQQLSNSRNQQLCVLCSF